MSSHAAIVPLIGGELIAAEEVFGAPPEWILSYEPFKDNEKHLLSYYDWQGKDVPYHLIDSEGFKKPDKRVDAVSSVCPCAGLSSYHNHAGEHNPNNQWMLKSTEYVLGEMKPKVLWGENAPALSTNSGTWIRNKLRSIGEKNGYRMSTYFTMSRLHGSPQVRKRTFYFFWSKREFEGIPRFKWFNRPKPTIQDVILKAEGNSLREPINKKTPSKDDPYYRYILEEVKGGMSHAEYVDSLIKDPDYKRRPVEEHIEKMYGIGYEQVGEKFREWGLDREADKCLRKAAKRAKNMGVMYRGTQVPVHEIGAFVVHLPTSLTHPIEDRYLSYREALAIMGMPHDFDLIDPEKSVNHICQNVPVMTARDIAGEVHAALKGERHEMVGSSYTRQNNVNHKFEIDDKGFTI